MKWNFISFRFWSMNFGHFSVKFWWFFSEFHGYSQKMMKCLEILIKTARKMREKAENSGICAKFNPFISFFEFFSILSLVGSSRCWRRRPIWTRSRRTTSSSRRSLRRAIAVLCVLVARLSLARLLLVLCSLLGLSLFLYISSRR